eukprot:3090836-Amphidinium_carterae.1
MPPPLAVFQTNLNEHHGASAVELPRPPCTMIFASLRNYATDMGYQHKAVHEAILQMAVEDIGRYEAENGADTITEHVKIATIVNNLKGPMGQQLMLRINQTTTFDEVHQWQWISNYFNSTYTSVDEDIGTIGNINEADKEQYDEWKNYNEETEEYDYEYNDDDVKYVAAMLNKGKGKRFREGKGKGGKDKGGKDNKTVTCYTCGQQGHISPNRPMKKGGKGNQGQEGPYKGQGLSTATITWLSAEWLQWLQWTAIEHWSASSQ